MTNFETVAKDYLAAWNETEPAARRAALGRVLASDARYVDPLAVAVAVAVGLDAIDATVAAVQGQFPGLVFALAGAVDAHHDQARFTWTLGPADGEPVVVGFDVVERDNAGQLTHVLGFLDQLPAGA